MKKSILLGFMLLLTASIAVAQNLNQVIEQQLVQLLEEDRITPADMHWQITAEHTSSVSGIKHIYFDQTINGIPVYGSNSSIHLYADGKVLKSNLRFYKEALEKGVTSTPALNEIQAVQSAANSLGYGITEGLSILGSKKGVYKETLVSDGGISLSEIPVRLVYQENQDGKLVLAWDLSIQEVAQLNWWSVRIDAATGAMLGQTNWMSSCNFEHDHSVHEKLNYHRNLFDIPNYKEQSSTEMSSLAGNNESYEVFAIPLESPYYGSRSIEAFPADPSASPFGWHDTNGVTGAEFTVTRGNNTNSYEDGNNQGFQPDGGAALDFTGFPFSQIYSVATPYEEAAITNLFYWNNVIHDVLHHYGFDEAGGNFQENNYGNGGAGSDSVNSEAQDGSGTCNANFGTPPDGNNPTMQMYVCGDKDGDFDNLVIIHEYGHGISNRLTGGPANSGCLGNQEQMGEGWSDWYGVVMTIEPGDTGTDARGVGTYLFGQGPGGAGIRPFPYTTDIAVNPHTYDAIKTAAVPHGVGSVWAEMLWEVTWGLINEHGWDPDIYNFTGDPNADAGNVMAMALVTEGMKLQPCSPGFVDGRDAIIAADLAIYGGINECILWDAFAKRGLGVSANQGSSGSRSDGTEAFDTPSQVAAFTAPEDVCEGTGIMTGLGGGTPQGGIYSGTGVTDDGNGSTYSFDPIAAGVGIHTISYDVPAGSCSVQSTASDDIEVFELPAGPTTTGVADFCLGNEVTVTAEPLDPLNVIRWYDAPTGGTFLSQGTDYTFTPTGNVTLYAQETPDVPLSQLVVSEITLQTPDALEIQNVGLAADYTGYAVAVSDTPYADINTVNPNVQILGAMGANSAQYWDDNVGSGQYWGSNLFWNDGSSGWILIIDDQGGVVDSVFWNVSAGDIAGFNVTVNGFNITAADLDWTGAGASLTLGCGQSYRRNGDTDNAANWANVCLASDFGVSNADINLGVAGCLGERSPADVTLDTEAPVVACQNITVALDANGTVTISSNDVDGGSTDNCDIASFEIDIDTFGCTDVGENNVLLTVTDVNGNSASCTAVVTVEDNLEPEVVCPADQSETIDTGALFTIPDYIALATITDNCTGSLITTQDPVEGSEVGVGTYTITVTAEDESGNLSECTFELEVTELLGIGGEFANEISLIPNPTRGRITLRNDSAERLNKAVISDVNGRIIQVIPINTAGTTTEISMELLSDGLYFVTIEGENSMTVKRIVKH
jgi:extracellular elastinolytic metalloproteinase